ncbi:MAG: phosphatidylcholine/phosphatidylserine synthase [Lentisphaeraceae bacterium]|nr:phosphatidylcholine/phosphatidylserine synthase [Lentisphaeraceae bacterium]
MSEEKQETVIKQSIWYKKIPTLLTIANSLCGFTAILWCLQAYERAILKSNGTLGDGQLPDIFLVKYIFASCAWLVIGAMIFDALDGWTARKLKATSLHGIQMDSLADMVTFGVTPAVIVAISSHINAISGKGHYIAEGLLRYDRLVWLSCGIYLACAACRLALYNVHAIEEKKDENFTGIPSPGAAAAVCSIIIMNNSNLVLPEWVSTIFLPIYTACLGVLMISTIPYPHMGKWLMSPVKRNRKFIVLGAIVAMCTFEQMRLGQGPKITAAGLITVYVMSGPIKHFYQWITGKNIPDDDEQLDEPTTVQ